VRSLFDADYTGAVIVYHTIVLNLQIYKYAAHIACHSSINAVALHHLGELLVE